MVGRAIGDGGTDGPTGGIAVGRGAEAGGVATEGLGANGAAGPAVEGRPGGVTLDGRAKDGVGIPTGGVCVGRGGALGAAGGANVGIGMLGRDIGGVGTETGVGTATGGAAATVGAGGSAAGTGTGVAEGCDTATAGTAGVGAGAAETTSGAGGATGVGATGAAATGAGGATGATGAAGGADVSMRAGVEANSVRASTPPVMEMTPPHTTHRARTFADGSFAGSTRKTERHSGQVTFIRRLPNGWRASDQICASLQPAGCQYGDPPSRPILPASLRSSSFPLPVR